MTRPLACRRALASVLMLVLISSQTLVGYSVLAHETIVDAAWKTDIRPLLLKRFRNATHEELRHAHACAYGGVIIQDLGYYPYGRKFFSDLTHYVRSGNFVQALLHEANDLCEYAFALGALAHYAGDNAGHRIAVNRVVPLLYPKLKNKYGDIVTYEEDKAAHLKTEFGFDVIEVAQGRFAPDAYHDFIGFEVAQPLLERAFKETYGLELGSVLRDENKAFESYRHAVSKTIPKATRVAWALKKNEIQHDDPTMTRKRFLYNISRASYEKNWGKDYRAPTSGEKFLAFLFRLVPKVGPLKALALHTPTPQAQQMFEASFNATLRDYRRYLSEWDEGHLVLVNDNFDVGEITPPGKYHLNDKTYAELLDRLSDSKFAAMTDDLRAEILRFYSDPNAPDTTRKDHKAWAKVQQQLERLRTTKSASVSTLVTSQ